MGSVTYGYGSGDGYGYGYGSGSGCGDGSGYGYGYGYGYGDGSGDGYGYGYGDGSGYGSGDGSGYGYGSGDGYGYGDGSGCGDGSGYGYGDGEFWKQFCASHPLARGKKNVVPAVWRSSKDGLPDNGGRLSTPTKAGDVHEATGPLRAYCGEGQLHATHNPEKWRGEKWFLVLMHEPVVFGDNKMWSLKRTILCEI